MDAALSHRGALLSAAFAAYLAAAVLFVAFEVPGLGIGHLFYLPIALVAVATGGLFGMLGGALATLLYVGCVAVNPRIPAADAITISTAIRGAAYMASGAFIGAVAQRNRELVERLRELADRDHLTGLLNARALEGRLLERCARGTAFALLLADLDGLKATNDRDGHAAGNELLRRVGTTLGAGVRAGDEVARVGGDEFAVLTEVGTAEAAERLAGRVEEELAARGVSASVGWALFPLDGTASIALYRRADERLYASKSARRARAEVVSMLRPRSAS